MRRRSPERVRLWRDVIDTWKRSGQTINAFCRDRKLTRSNFDRWRRILAAERAQSKSSTFVPVRVVADPMVEIVLPSGVLVRLPLPAMPSAMTRATSCPTPGPVRAPRSSEEAADSARGHTFKFFNGRSRWLAFDGAALRVVERVGGMAANDRIRAIGQTARSAARKSCIKSARGG